MPRTQRADRRRMTPAQSLDLRCSYQTQGTSTGLEARRTDGVPKSKSRPSQGVTVTFTSLSVTYNPRLDSPRLMDYFKHTILAILSSGPVPQHVGFVMDGNRRYARRRNEQVQQGHQAGFQALRRVGTLSQRILVWLPVDLVSSAAKTLEVCLRLGVKCVSVYAFSIENFKRSPTEVDAIMELAKTKLLELCGEGCVC